MTQVGAPQGSNKVKCFKYAKGHYCENFYQTYSAKNTQRDTHKTRNPLFPPLETS